MPNVSDHQRLIEWTHEICEWFYGFQDTELKTFIEGTMGLNNLKDGVEKADTQRNMASINLRGTAYMLNAFVTAGISVAYTEYFISKYYKHTNAFHHFGGEGYSLDKDPAGGPISKLRTYMKEEILDDCDSKLDPLSLDENGGDCERYDWVYLEDTQWKGYRFKSAPFYGKLLWLDYWGYITKGRRKQAAICLGKIAHLAQDLGGVPQHAVGTIGDNHKEFEDYLLKHYNSNSSNKTTTKEKAITDYINDRNRICNYVGLIEGGSRNIVDISMQDVLKECESFSKEFYNLAKNEDNFDDAAKNTMPYALAATYTVLKLGQLAWDESRKANGRVLAGGTFSVVALNAPGWAAGNFCSRRENIWLPHGYVLDKDRGNGGHIMEEIESSDVRERIISPVYEERRGQYREGMRIEAKVHGSNWWGPRGYLYQVHTIYGKKPDLKLYITKCAYNNRRSLAILQNGQKVRGDLYKVKFQWDWSDVQKGPRECTLLDGLPLTHPNRVTYIGRQRSKKGQDTYSLSIYVNTTQSKFPYHHILTVGMQGPPYNWNVFKTSEICVEEPAIEIKPSIQGCDLKLSDLFCPRLEVGPSVTDILRDAEFDLGRPPISPAIAAMADFTGLIARNEDIEVVNEIDETSEQGREEIDNLWGRRILVKGATSYATPVTVPGVTINEYNISIDYKLGYIKKQIRLDFEKHALLEPCNISGVEKIISDGEVTTIYKIAAPRDRLFIQFNRENYNHDVIRELSIETNDPAGQKCSAKHTFYAKALLCVVNITCLREEAPVDLSEHIKDGLVVGLREEVEEILSERPGRPGEPGVPGGPIGRIDSRLRTKIKKFLGEEVSKSVDKVLQKDREEKERVVGKIVKMLTFERDATHCLKRIELLKGSMRGTELPEFKKFVEDDLKKRRVVKKTVKKAKNWL